MARTCHPFGLYYGEMNQNAVLLAEQATPIALYEETAKGNLESIEIASVNLKMMFVIHGDPTVGTILMDYGAGLPGQRWGSCLFLRMSPALKRQRGYCIKLSAHSMLSHPTELTWISLTRFSTKMAAKRSGCGGDACHLGCPEFRCD